MTRRRPAQVRGGLAARRPAAFTVVDGLDAAAQLDVRALERSRLTPGAVAKALESWRQQVRLPRRYAADTAYYGCPCCDGGYGRAELDIALHALPRRSARQLRALVEPVDRAFLARTLPDPHTPDDRPWWERRC
ncbi:hypothetical protein ACFYWU_23685 [Streptomyces chrestomyceticus]|uniref:hypothetical protein n=1 Tax=Streptomyces chrestomyceticus TaxID=68185 RepID=UPI00369CD21F